MKERGRVPVVALFTILIAWRFMGAELWLVLATGLILAFVTWYFRELRKVFSQSGLGRRLHRFTHGNRMTSFALFAVTGAVAGAVIGAGLWALLAFTRPTEEAKPVEAPVKIPENPPLAEVTINEELTAFHLAVVNRGAPADFHAQLEIVTWLSPQPFGSRTVFPAYWEQGKSSKTQIATGMQDRLFLGDVRGDPKQQSLFVHYFESQQGGIGDIIAPSKHPHSPPFFTVRVSISSVPPMKDGPFRGKYLVGGHGLTEAAPDP